MSTVSLHRRPDKSHGFVSVVQAGKDLRHISFGLLRLDGGETHPLEPVAQERVVVLLAGSLRVRGRGWEHEAGPRRAIFADRASAVYVPAGEGATLECIALGTEAAIISSPTTEPARPFSVGPSDVRVARRGKPGFAREVHDVVDGQSGARRLLVGETYNAPGEWSSYPPHKHDRLIPGVETPLEEVYYFRIDPPQGFGVQMIYSPDHGLDESYRVLDGDVTILPFGYHPVAAAPGYRLYYLWALAGEGHRLSFHDDPAHAWVKG